MIIVKYLNEQGEEFDLRKQYNTVNGIMINAKTDEDKALCGFIKTEIEVPDPISTNPNQARIDEIEAYLTSTDWYAIRHSETGVEIPSDVATKRQQAREEISQLRGD